MRVDRVETAEVQDSGRKNAKVKIKEKDGVVTKTIEYKENGVKTKITEITYPDGSTKTTKKMSGCGPKELGTVFVAKIDLSQPNGIAQEAPVDGFDSNPNSLVTDKIKSIINTRGGIVPSDIVDADGKIKKGFEIFDINSDGRLSDNEFSWFANGGVIKQGESDAKQISRENFNKSIHALDTNMGTTKADGIISSEERQELYSMLDAPEHYY